MLFKAVQEPARRIVGGAKADTRSIVLELIVIFPTGIAAADQVNGSVERDGSGIARLADVLEQLRLAHQFDENLLKRVSLRHASGSAEKRTEPGRAHRKAFQFACVGHRSGIMTPLMGRFV